MIIIILLSIFLGFLLGSYIRKNHPTIDLSYGRMIDFIFIMIIFLSLVASQKVLQTSYRTVPIRTPVNHKRPVDIPC